MDNLFEKNTVILFQGDSITDCGRSREDPNGLGDGYVRLISAMLSDDYPQYNLKFINRGVSGDKVEDLVYRWDEDCIVLKPDWLSILIGVNDTLGTTLKKFEEGYRFLLRRATKELNSKIILCEPFLLLEENTPWRKKLTPKIEVVHKLAKEFDTILVSLDEIFQESCALHSPEFWAPDGVHPSPEGHALIAKSWIKYVQEAPF
jgi:lysophospholipase L1-like esterase